MAILVEVAVPSHARADTVSEKTLRTLAEGGVDRERVRLFVTPDQLDAYRAAVDPGLVAEIVPGAYGLAAQRREIAGYYEPGCPLVQLDDDVAGVDSKHDDKTLVPVTDLPAMFERGFNAARQWGARLWGVYPVRNALFMKHRVSYGLPFCIGQLWGVLNSREPELQVEIANKEDYERTLRFYTADGVVVRLDDVVARSKLYGPGGLQAEDQPDRHHLNRREVQWLMSRWPQHVKLTKRRSKVGLEIRLVP